MQITKTLPFTIYSLAWSPDGRHIAVSGSGRTVRIWDMEQKRGALICRGHQGHVRSVAYSPDGSRLASIGEDQMVWVWNPLTGEPLLHFQCARSGGYGISSKLSSLAWSPDGRRLATLAKHEPVLRIWDVETGELLFTYGDRRGLPVYGSVYSFAWSPDGSQMATSTFDQTLEIWNIADGSVRQAITVGLYVYGITWSLDAAKITAIQDHKFFVVDVATGAIQYTDRYMDTPIAWSADRRFLAYKQPFTKQEQIIILNVEDKTIVRRLPEAPSKINRLHWLPDGRLLVAGSRDKTVHIWSLDDADNENPPIQGLY
jgi:WD40 repeat protein